MFLDLLRSAHGPKLLRVKGLVGLADDPEHPVVIHGVQHVFHVPAVLPAWPDDDRRSRLVFIVKDLDKSFVERLWDAFLGKPRIDRPGRGGAGRQSARPAPPGLKHDPEKWVRFSDKIMLRKTDRAG